MADNDPLLKIKANQKLSDLELQADLNQAGGDFAKLMVLKAPDITEIVSEAELKTLIDAIKAGTASNNQMTQFINAANKVLAKV